MYKILIVEDEIGTARPVKEALELYGYEADIASDGEIGLELFEKNKYDLILLDLKMPKMTGEELLRKIRQKDPYIYVLIYTNYSNYTDIKALTNIGIDGYVNKGPGAELQELIDMIQDKLNPLDEDKLQSLVESLHEVPVK